MYCITGAAVQVELPEGAAGGDGGDDGGLFPSMRRRAARRAVGDDGEPDDGDAVYGTGAGLGRGGIGTGNSQLRPVVVSLYFGRTEVQVEAVDVATGRTCSTHCRFAHS